VGGVAASMPRTVRISLSLYSTPEAANYPRDLLRLAQELLKIGLIQVTDAGGHVKVRAELAARAFCGRQKLMELRAPTPLESLGNV
jgi:hypothetical protein